MGFRRNYLLVLLTGFVMVGTMSFVRIGDMPCDMQVKDGLNGLSWRCITGDCDQCGVTGHCRLFIELNGYVTIESCDCEGADGQVAPADCTTNINVHSQTGIISIFCWNSCCENLCPAIPEVQPPYLVWTDPCPCPGL